MLRMQEAKKLAKYEIPREINTVENLSRLLPFNRIKITFFPMLVTKKPRFLLKFQNFDKIMLN